MEETGDELQSREQLNAALTASEAASARFLVDREIGFDLLDERGMTHLVLGLQAILVRQASLRKK